MLTAADMDEKDDGSCDKSDMCVKCSKLCKCLKMCKMQIVQICIKIVQNVQN